MLYVVFNIVRLNKINTMDNPKGTYSYIRLLVILSLILYFYKRRSSSNVIFILFYDPISTERARSDRGQHPAHDGVRSSDWYPRHHVMPCLLSTSVIPSLIIRRLIFHAFNRNWKRTWSDRDRDRCCQHYE